MRRSRSDLVPYEDNRNRMGSANNNNLSHRNSSGNSLQPMRQDSIFDDLFGSSRHQQLLPFGDFGFSSMFQPVHRGATGGTFSSQVMVMSSSTGPDGRRHVEQYASSTAGNIGQQMRETKEMYTNSSSGVDRMGWQRSIRGQGRRVQQERNRHTGEVVETDELQGMSRDDECNEFNATWNQLAPEFLPQSFNRCLQGAPERRQDQQATRRFDAIRDGHAHTRFNSHQNAYRRQH